MKKAIYLLPLLALIGCKSPDPNPSTSTPPVSEEIPGEGYTPEFNAEFVPSYSYAILPYSGEVAADAPQYPAMDDGLNPQLTVWKYLVEVTFNGDEAPQVKVPTGCPATVKTENGNVDIDLGDTDYIKLVVGGESEAGSLRVAGNKRHLIQLNNLTLRSTDRPAINDQNGKRLFLDLVGQNVLSDGTAYISAPVGEDRKGAFFSEGNTVICGDGSLEVTGNYSHGFATDGFLYVNPGATLVVNDAVRNAIHVKGSASEANSFRGVEIVGGYVYANTSSPRGKALKSDSNIQIRGGSVSLNCSGNAAIDPTDGSLSSPACIKSDLTVRISGGSVNLTATGDGAKGIKANGAVELNGGDLHIALSGNAITGGGDSATPKGIKADGNLMINGGGNYVSARGARSIGIESGYGMVIDGGVTYTFGPQMGILFGRTGAYCSGVVLAGGESNSDFNSAYTMSLTNVQSQTISKIMSEDGKELIGSFRWPVAMKSASLTILK